MRLKEREALGEYIEKLGWLSAKQFISILLLLHTIKAFIIYETKI